MRLEFEPNVIALPLVENEMFDEVTLSADFQDLLKRGIAAAQSGNREHARTLLVNAAQQEPKSEDAWIWLASISEYPEELLAFLNNVLNINPDNKRANEWRTATCSLLAKTFVQRGVTAHEQGSTDQAAQCFDQALVYDYNCEMAWFWKASLVDNNDQKEEFYGRVLSINTDNSEARSALNEIARSRSVSAVADAKAAAVAGNAEQALEILDGVLQNDAHNLDAWMLRSHLASSVQDKLSSLEKVLEIDPENAAARSSYDFLATTVVAEAPVEEAVEPEVEAAHEEMEVAPEPESVDVQDEHAQEDVRFSEPEPVYVQEEEATLDQEAEVVQEEEPVYVQEEMAVHMTETEDIHITDPSDAPAYEEPAWSVEEMFPSAPDEIEAEHDTAEKLPSLNDIFEQTGPQMDFNSDTFESSDPAAIFDSVQTESEPLEVEVAETIAAAPPSGVACPFCWEPNEAQAFECGSCHATLTLSDIESLLANPRADRETVQHAVTQMEAEWNMREFDEKELTALGIGHFNLQNYDAGLNYLQEASRLSPNDVMLSGHLNTIAIRLEEMRRQDEVHNAMPKGRTILVVDDSPTVRKLISGKLEKSGHTVVCAEDGVEGLARIEENIPDLVLLDITMPRMDGYEVCRQIRANPVSKDVPVVMISGKDGFFDKVRGRMAGTTGYVTKPFGPETLMKALETYLVQDSVPVE